MRMDGSDEPSPPTPPKVALLPANPRAYSILNADGLSLTKANRNVYIEMLNGLLSSHRSPATGRTRAPRFWCSLLKENVVKAFRGLISIILTMTASTILTAQALKDGTHDLTALGSLLGLIGVELLVIITIKP